MGEGVHYDDVHSQEKRREEKRKAKGRDVLIFCAYMYQSLTRR